MPWKTAFAVAALNGCDHFIRRLVHRHETWNWSYMLLGLTTFDMARVNDCHRHVGPIKPSRKARAKAVKPALLAEYVGASACGPKAAKELMQTT